MSDEFERTKSNNEDPGTITMNERNVAGKAQPTKKEKQRKSKPPAADAAINTIATGANEHYPSESLNEELLRVLTEVRNGNLGARMPAGQDGINGKICDTLNEILLKNQKKPADSTHGGHVIDKNARMHHRIHEQHLVAANKLLEKEIQERRKSEDKIRHLNHQLMENINKLKSSNEELERFAYVASHDLQEPLRKIILFSDQLSIKYHDVLGTDGQDFVKRITKASERLRILIKNILTFSRSASSADPSETTDLNTLIDSILSDLEVCIDQKKAIFQVSRLPELKIIPEQFRQLFQNLVINALKFSKPNTPPVVRIYGRKAKGREIVGITANRADESFYCIYVEDNGIGFEQKYADEIFTLFKRLNSYDKFEGTGIGLSICKKIADKHHGHITATSTVGQGSTFIIAVPVPSNFEAPASISVDFTGHTN
jgi:signal transduction histidine kinase